jgi:uncharacterized protein (DUF302 family)
VEFAYKRRTVASFADTTEAVEACVRDHGFDVRHTYDIRAALEAKGFPIRPLVVFEIAPAEDELDEAVSLIMPCRVHIYEEGEAVIVAAIRPTLFSAVFPEHDLDAIAERFEAEMIEVVDAAADRVGAG